MSIKADATLVNAAYRMGMASVPPDTSRIFQNQFRALRDMHRSAVEGMKSVIEAGTTMLEKKGQADEFQRSYDQLSKDFLKNSGEFISRHYKNGKGPDKDTVEYAKQELVDIKEQIETLRNMPGTRTPEQNEQLKALEKNVATWREENNKTLGLLTAHGDMHASDLVDDNQSFMITDPVTGEQKVDSNMRGLYTQIIHPGIPLSSVGIKLGRNEKGQRGYYYDASVNRTLQTAEITSPDGDGTSQTEIKPGSMKFISEEELFGMVVQKDLAVVNNIADRISEGFMSSDLSRETKSFVKDPKTGRLVQSKTIEPEVKTYDDITLKGKEDFYNIITATHNVDENGVRTKRDIRAGLHYLQNNPIQVGTAMLNYNEDSKSNPNINTLTYSQLGLSGKGIDKNNDGRLSGDELTEEDRDIIHQRLMNPRTPEEIEIASRELADYFDRQTRDQFNKRRGSVPTMEIGGGGTSSTGGTGGGDDDYLKAFPSGTNYGTYEKEDGSSVSITGDTFRSLYKRFASGVIRTSNNIYRLQKQGYWQDKDGKRYNGTKMLEMFQPPKGPSLLSSTDFARFKGDMRGGGVTKRNQTPIMLDTSLKIDE